MICVYCKRETVYSMLPGKLRGLGGLLRTKDHVIPRSRGGRVTVVCCAKCNGLKGDMMPDAWEQFMQDNPRWWLTDRTKHTRPDACTIGRRVYDPRAYPEIEEASQRLNRLRASPDYLPVPLSYADPIAQLAYEAAMQNPRNRVALRQWLKEQGIVENSTPRATKAPAAALRTMTAKENAERLQRYWMRQAIAL